MNWLTNSVLPKIKALVQAREVPDNLWHKCVNCGQMIFHRELEDNLNVCPHCHHHGRISAERRLELLFDDGLYKTLELAKSVADPLKFRDRKRYSERLKEAQGKTKRSDAIIVAEGLIGDRKTVVAVFDFSFMGGSMGVAVGNALVLASEAAVAAGAPLIAFPASGGARMQEGILSLMQMPRTVLAVEAVKEARLPFIVVLTDPTTGGVTASFAMIGDLHLAEPGAIIGFAGQRVIKDVIREDLPEGFQRSEYLLEHGMIDMVVERSDLRDTLIRVLGLLTDRHDPQAQTALPGPTEHGGSAANPG